MTVRIVTLVGGPFHGRRMPFTGSVYREVDPFLRMPSLIAGVISETFEQPVTRYVRSKINPDLMLYEGGAEAAQTNEHYCKWCETSFPVNVPARFTGDAIIDCPVCSHGHHRQFELGVAVSCNVVSSEKPRRFRMAGAEQ